MLSEGYLSDMAKQHGNSVMSTSRGMLTIVEAITAIE
jgi:hypothetical protein